MSHPPTNPGVLTAKRQWVRRFGPIISPVTARYLVIDLLIAVAYLLAWVMGSIWSWPPDSDADRFLLFYAGGVMTACIFIRRLIPLPAALIGSLVPVVIMIALNWRESLVVLAPWRFYLGPGSGPFDIIAPVVLIFTVALSRPGIQALIAAIGAEVSATLCLWFWLPSVRSAVLVSAICILAIAVSALAGSNIRVIRLRVQELTLRALQLDLEREQRESLAIVAERTRIAREMHDILAHSLSVMITLADGGARVVHTNPDLSAQALNNISEAGRSALADTRRLIGVLREEDPNLEAQRTTAGAIESAHQNPPANMLAPQIPIAGKTRTISAPAVPRQANLELLPETDPSTGGVPLAPQPSSEDVGSLIERFISAGIPVNYRFIGPPLPNDKALQLAAYRIVQESLTNILKYAPAATKIEVTMRRTTGNLQINVVNNNPSLPIPTQNGGGSQKGLIGMRERVSVFAGSVQAGPVGNGWQVQAELKWTETDEGTTAWTLPT